MKNPITAKRLALALSNLNMKPQELANASGVSKASISQYLSGSHSPSNISSGKMSQILKVNPLWLMGFDVPMNDQTTNRSNVTNLYNIQCTTKEECDLIRSYRDLNTENQGKCRAYTQNLLTTQRMEDDLLAAHARTDIEPTPEGLQHDLDIMNDDSEWED